MKNLSTYLNDHLAGSVGALEMLDDLIDAQKDQPIAPFLRTLRTEIESDQEQLKQLMARFEIGESGMRKAGAWVAEKFSRMKLGASETTDLALLQSFEGLSLGIAGKRSLWRTLMPMQSNPILREFDLTHLEKRAGEQYERVQTKVVELGQEIFSAELSG